MAVKTAATIRMLIIISCGCLQQEIGGWTRNLQSHMVHTTVVVVIAPSIWDKKFVETSYSEKELEPVKSDAQAQFSNLQCNNILGHRGGPLFAGSTSMCYPPIYNDMCFHRRASRWYDDNAGYNPDGFIICPKPWNGIPNSTTNLNFRLATLGV